MTPDKAGDLLAGATPGPWFFDDDMDGRMHKIGPIVPAGTELECTTDDAALAAHAPDMAAMIAGMRAQYGVEVQRPNGDWLPPYSWHDSPEQARNCVTAIHGRATANRRIIRRYVTEPEEIK